MRRFTLTPRTLPALGLGFALALAPSTGYAQNNSSLSSGSGTGTGTGFSAGSVGSTGTGTESNGGMLPPPPGRTGPGAIGRPPGGLFPRPGENLSRPGERRIVDVSQNPGLSYVAPELFLDARAVRDPGERALALIRIGQVAIFSRQFQVAHDALFEAGPAALAEQNPLIREQRQTAIIEQLLLLAEERMSDSAEDEVPPADATAPPAPPAPGASPSVPATPPVPVVDGRVPAAALPAPDRKKRLADALSEWTEAVNLATRVELITPRTEALFRIVESEAFSSQRLITEPIRVTGGRPDPAKLPADLRAYTDMLLVNAAQHAQMIERPIWRNFAKYSVVSNAAASSQFPRGFEIARGIEQPEARTDALIRLAEGQATNERPNDATAAYNEAVRAVALIPQEDPRETLIGVLIDSLISYGRFDDARACVPLYTVVSRQVVALSAVAESQGRRGLGESARLWIGRDIAPEYRPLLYRKVNDGILYSVQRNRSNDLSQRSP